MSRERDSQTQSAERFDEERTKLLNDLSAARELSKTLEKARNDIKKQITRTNIENEHLRVTIDSLTTEKNALIGQLHSEVS